MSRTSSANRSRRAFLQSAGGAVALCMAPSVRAAALTPEGAALRDALRREAREPGKAEWQPMLHALADLHGRSVLPAIGFFPHAYQSIGPGYQDGRVFGHIDLTHARIDTVRADPEHVRRQIRNELAGQQPDGLIPGIVQFDVAGKATWKNFKGFPPIWVVAAEDYFAQTGDVAFQRECLVALEKQIGWFEAKRLLPEGGFYYLDLVEDTWESGMDMGIRYDERPPKPDACVDACAHLYLIYDAAARWAETLRARPNEWARKRDALGELIRRQLWDERSGFFYDRWLMKAEAKRHLAFEGMWPVVVGAATAEQARRVIDEHLLNPREFFAPHPIATVALSDPKFELRMWRGPAWNCMTYWAARGCVRYGRHAAARQLLEAALDSTAAEFKRSGVIWEFYHPQRGDPATLRRKPARNKPWTDYVGHNPLFAMVDMWRKAVVGVRG